MNGSAFTAEHDGIILAGRKRTPPLGYDVIGELLDRSAASVRYRYKLLIGRQTLGLSVADAADYALPAAKEWPAWARFDGKRDTGEGSVPFHVRLTPTIPLAYRSATGNAGSMCAESRGATNR